MAVQRPDSGPSMDLDGSCTQITQVTIERNVNQKVKKSLFFHHLLQISDESSEVDFDVIKHTKLLWAVLSSAFLPYLIKVGGEKMLDMYTLNETVSQLKQ